MKQEYLRLMKCPYCGSGFKLGEIHREILGDIIEGVIVCDCDKFPIIDGILILKPSDINDYIIQLINDGKTKQAIGLLMGHFGERAFQLERLLRTRGILGEKLGEILSLIEENRATYNYNRYSDDKSSFYSMLGKGESEIYLKSRFSAETFWSLYPFIPLLKTSRERVLDLSCGMGHSSFVLSSYVKPQELVCVDYSFRHLYLAKKYFVKDAEFICLDANYSLPFKDNVFSTIIMQDAFHYIRGRYSLAQEMERVVSPQGILLLLHLHNSLNYNIAAGQPLTPKGWFNLFKHVTVKLLPEKNVVEDFIWNNKLDLSKEYSESDLNRSNALGIIGTRDKSNLYVHRGVWEDILTNKCNLVINPIYTIERNVDGAILRRKFPSESFKREFPIMGEYLPEKCTINRVISEALNGRVLDITSIEISEYELNHIEELMRKFVVINAPQNYC